MTPQERDTILKMIADVEKQHALVSNYDVEIILKRINRYVRAATDTPVPVWITRDDEVIRIVDIDDDHLLAIERAIAAGTAPATETDRANITKERERRGLEALRPRQPMEARISKNLTDFRAIYHRANENTRRHILKGLAAFLHEASSFMNEEDQLEVNHAADVIETVKPGDAQRLPPARRDMKDVMFGEKWGQRPPIVHAADAASLSMFIQNAIRPEITKEEAEALKKQWTEQWPALAHLFDGLIKRPPVIHPDLVNQGFPTDDASHVSQETIEAVKSFSDRRQEIRDMLVRGEITQMDAHAEFPETFPAPANAVGGCTSPPDFPFDPGDE